MSIDRHVEQLPRSRGVVLALAFGEEPVVTDAMETGREHVDEKAADELAGSERHHLDACGSFDAVVLLLEGDAVVDGDEAAVGDGDAMGVVVRGPLRGESSSVGRISSGCRRGRVRHPGRSYAHAGEHPRPQYPEHR
jgi:hypothetical protein